MDCLDSKECLKEFMKLKKQLDSEKWTVSEQQIAYGFFLHGWFA